MLACFRYFGSKESGKSNLALLYLTESSRRESLIWDRYWASGFTLSHFILQQTWELCAISRASQMMKLRLK